MNEWHDFFLAQAGAAGVLTGLVFVGVSINLQKIVSDPRSGLAGRAAEALILLGTPEQRRDLWEQLKANHDATLTRHCEPWERRRGGCGFGFDDELGGAQAGLDLQKLSVVATERDERARNAFRERLSGVDPKRLIFVDGSSTNIALTPRYGRAPKGERAFGTAPRNRGKNVTLISSIGLEGMGASMSIEGPSDTDSFSLYMREILTRKLAPCILAFEDVDGPVNEGATLMDNAFLDAALEAAGELRAHLRRVRDPDSLAEMRSGEEVLGFR